LSKRLALVLPHLIHPDQAGFIRGRSAPDIAMTLKTVLAHAAEHSVDGALVFLDQEKAYDRVSHSYLETVLHAFGFPSSLASIFLNTSGPAMLTSWMKANLSPPSTSLAVCARGILLHHSSSTWPLNHC